MGWEKYNDYILYSIVLAITVIISRGTNIFFQMMTIDSVFSAIHFIKQYMDHRVSDSQIIYDLNPLYNHSVLDRYIYYILSYLSYTTFCNFFWIKIIKLIYYGFIFTSIPKILNKILSNVIFDRIRKKKEHIIKIIMSKQLGAIIEFSSKTYLNKTIKVNHHELMILFDDYNTTLYHCIDIIKNLSLVLLTMYVKKYSTVFYYKMLKYVYSYKTGNELISFNERTAKKRLINIIEHKHWIELLDPNVYKAIIHLYQLYDNQIDLFGEIMKNFYYNLGKMFTIWTISSFLNQILIGPILSIFLLLYRTDKNKLYNMEILKKILIILGSSIYGSIYGNYLITSIICQFGYDLIFNKLICIIVRYIRNETIKKINDLNIINAEYILPTMTTTIFIISFGYLLNSATIMVIMLDIIRNVIINTDKKKTIIYCVLLGTACLSNFNSLHIIHNAFVIYIIMAFLDYNRTRNLISYTKKSIHLTYSHLTKEKDILMIDLNRTYSQIKKYILNKNVNVNVNVNVNDYSKIRLEIWENNDLYPSISKKLNSRDIHVKMNTQESMEYDPLNNQQVLQIIKPELNTANIRDKLFALDDNDFVDAISADSGFFMTNNCSDSLIIESIMNENYYENKSDVDLEVIENFC